MSEQRKHPQTPGTPENPDRRDFLKGLGLAGGAAVTGAGGLGYPEDSRAAVETRARIVIVGGGAGGITAAAKLARWLDGARITVIEPRATHRYQPGWVFVGAGIMDKEETIDRRTGELLPDDIDWRQTSVAEFDPDNDALTTDDGERIDYDYLLVATGCQLNYADIDGLSRDDLGRDGITSVYAGADQAEAMWQAMQRFVENGGRGVFTKPATPLKCAGAPLKMAYLTESRLVEAGRREAAELVYHTPDRTLFSVPEIADLAARRFREKSIDFDYGYTLTAVDKARRTATFTGPDGTLEEAYDFLHVVPPMSAPDAVRDSALAWQTGDLAAGGWLEVDKVTLQHKRYPNVFGAGDVNGIPMGKTAASVKFQAPIAARHIVNLIEDRAFEERYNGYTSCPLVTGIGKAALVEFNYQAELIPTIPFMDPTKDKGIWWLMDLYMMKPYYMQMLKGRIPA